MYVLSFRLCMTTVNICYCTKIHISPASKPGREGAVVYDADRLVDGPVTLTRLLARYPVIF